MSKHLYGLRGLLVAIVVIVLSAGAAAAAGPSDDAANGLATAAEKAGKTVPVVAQEETEQDEDAEQETEDETEEETDAEPASAGGDHCATDPTDLDPEALAELNHGAIVCWAAHQETPEGFDNHGAWVSSWAMQNKGHADGELAAASTNRGQSKDKPGHGSSGD